MEKQTVFHTIEPIYDSHSKILLLGSMPSPKSRETAFYYGHPQNRFWRVLSDVLGNSLPTTNEEKKELLINNHIALWDVLASCQIEGADDNSIRNPIPNDIGKILINAPIAAIFTTGGAASRFYDKLCLSETKREAIRLPSTSPANCRFTYDKLKDAYQAIADYLK